MAQSSEEGRLGELGVTETCRNIERLGWGTTVNSRHDFGTDIFILVLGPKGEDLQLIVGAQVKTGDSYFKEPRFSEDGELEGWWYRDRKRAHVDSWASHSVPHLIVLHDLEKEASYWAHVTSESVVSTGIGAKVFVAKRSLIDDDHRAELEAVAATNRGGAFEGSAWTGKSPPKPTDALRYALIVPRLVAPHPNAGQAKPLTSDRGLALVVLDRLQQYERFAEEQRSVPTLERARTSKRWGWRLLGALAVWLLRQDPEELIAAVDSASNPAARAAAGVLAVGALIDSNELDHAGPLLKKLLGEDGYAAVDRAWLELQYARWSAEIGDLETARRTALTAYSVRPYAGADATAGALLGAAAALIFDTSDWGAKELEDLIGAGDTVAVWWRSQTTRYGLGALADRNFKMWAREEAVTFGAEDAVDHRLESSALMAGNAADQSGWRHLSSLRGRSELMGLDRFADPAEAHVGLRRLMIAGDAGSLKLAVRHLVADGPATAVTLAGHDLRLGQASHTSAFAEITFLTEGGTLLETKTADWVVSWLLATLVDQGDYHDRVTPTFALTWGLLDALRGVVGAAGTRVQRKVIRHLAGLPPQRHQGLANQWARVLEAPPARAWTRELQMMVKPRSGRHHRVLQVPLLGIASKHDRGARRALHNQVKRGDLDSLAALGDVTRLPDAIASQIIERSARAIRRMIAEAKKGTFGGGGNDAGEALVLLNAWHPRLAKWKPVYDLLEEPGLMTSQKQRSIVILGNLVDHLPEPVRERLRPVSVALARGEGAGLRSPFESDQDVVGRAWNLAVLLGAIDLDADATPMADLLGGDAEHRRWAAFLAARLRRQGDVGALAVLSNDPHPMVRGSAAWGLATMLNDDIGGDLVDATLRRAVDDGGVWVSDAIAGALSVAARPGPVARELLVKLKTHPSSVVRASARGED